MATSPVKPPSETPAAALEAISGEVGIVRFPLIRGTPPFPKKYFLLLPFFRTDSGSGQKAPTHDRRPASRKVWRLRPAKIKAGLDY